MAVRIVGVDLPQNKRGAIALTYIYGIGRSAALTILEKAAVDPDIQVKDWTDAQACLLYTSCSSSLVSPSRSKHPRRQGGLHGSRACPALPA